MLTDFLLCFQAIITLILATDMARHGEILDSFKQKVDNFDFTNEEHVTCVCMHSALHNHIETDVTSKQAGLYPLSAL